MEAKLGNCTKEEQQSVIHYLWVEGVPGGQIHQRMCAQYEDSVLSCRVVYKWIEMFKNSCMSVTDAECSGCTVTTTIAQNEERARELFLQNRREITKPLNIISIGSGYSVMHGNLQFHKACARWVPKELTDEHNRMYLDIYSCHLACYCKEGDNFLQRIITGDETWVTTINQKPSRIACNGSVCHLLLKRNSRCNHQ
jgi:hypothetical protein